MAIDYLSYTKRGFLPAPRDNDKSFLTRSDKTIDFSERIRFMAANRDETLETMLEGTADMFNLNPYHGLACKDIHLKLGMYPEHFVGFHTDITKVMRKDSPYKKRDKLQGVRDSINFNKIELPFYVVDEKVTNPIEVSVHELYHCIFKAQDVRRPLSIINLRIESMIEEFRGDLLMDGKDISVDYKFERLRQNSEMVKDIIAKSKIKLPCNFEQMLNKPLVRKIMYMEYQRNYEKQMRTNLNLTAKTLLAAGTLALGILNPLLTANLIAQAIFTTGGFSAGIFISGCALHDIYSNYKVTKANEEVMNFMAHTRESLSKEFGIKGANFIAYTLYHPEILEMARYNSAKDYFHKKGTTRSKALLEHALAL
ncbi:MAG: hypothetical protein V1906_03195 [Candidatus Woesearchaeota archaeon]